MNAKISRNEPCPCGSGKKYKKCCGMQKTVSITSIIEKEVIDLQVQLIQYAIREYEFEIEQDFEHKVEELLIEDEEEMEYYLFIHTVWFALFEHVDNGGTILQRFIEEKSRMIQRPKVKEILQSWTNPRPLAGRLLSIDESNMTVLDTLTEEALSIKILEPIESAENSFVFGFLVPFGNEWTFFPTAFDLEGETDDKDEQFIKDRFSASDYDEPIDFLADEMIYMMNELPYASFEYGASDFKWSNESHRAVAELYESEMKNLDASPMVIAGGNILWYKYCEKVAQLTKKPATYAAAVQYLTLTLNPLMKITKKEVAHQYGISPATLSVAVTDMESVVDEELTDMRAMYAEDINGEFENRDMPF